MPISVMCQHCSAKMTAKDELLGKTVKCPKCRESIVIEGAQKPVAPTGVAPQSRVADKTQETSRPKAQAKALDEAVEVAEVAPPRAKRSAAKKSDLPDDPEQRYRAMQTIAIRGFDGNIDPIHSPLTYRAGMFLALCVMVVLPIVYVALIGLVGYGVYWHAVTNTGIFQLASETRGRNSGRAYLMALAVYSAPILIGIILVAFMFKPLFSKPERARKPRTLSREKEPLLFAFVDRLCDAVHAPRPKQIDVDLQVNASASFRNGVWSMFGSDLTLTLGLPLIAGLSMKNFAGILAHEFGHFAQGAGMRVTYVVRSIAYWFQRVVYERDQWDAQLEEWSRESDLRIGWIFYLTRAFVWLTRRVLWVLMMIGHGVSCLMLRQMEFDADRHEARMSGSETFAETAKQLRLISIADGQSWDRLQDGYREGRLIDDLPRFTLANYRSLPKQARDYVDAMTSEAKTGWFDTHPSDPARNQNAMAEDTDGIFHLSHPAMFLFKNFPSLSKATTLDLYKEVFGKSFDQSLLYSVDETLARQEEEQAAHESMNRFFQGNFTFHRPIMFEDVEILAPTNREKAIEGLKTAREDLVEAAPNIHPAIKVFRESAGTLATLAQVRELFRAGVKVPPGFSSFEVRKLSDAETIEAEEFAKQEKLEKRLSRWDAICRRRVFSGLSLLFDPEMDTAIEKIESYRKHCRELLTVMNSLSLQVGTMKSLLITRGVIGGLLQVLEKDPKNEKANSAIRIQARGLAQPVRGMHQALSFHVYPFPTPKENMTIAEYAFAEPPHVDDLQGQFEAAQALVETVMRLYSRALGQLCLFVEHVETALGLPPLPAPPEEEPASD